MSRSTFCSCSKKRRRGNSSRLSPHWRRTARKAASRVNNSIWAKWVSYQQVLRAMSSAKSLVSVISLKRASVRVTHRALQLQTVITRMAVITSGVSKTCHRRVSKSFRTLRMQKTKTRRKSLICWRHSAMAYWILWLALAANYHLQRKRSEGWAMQTRKHYKIWIFQRNVAQWRVWTNHKQSFPLATLKKSRRLMALFPRWLKCSGKELAVT